ncbi:MAG: DUF882 domain-containing protein [Synergistaceae bacterium]|nr:DUF882 domain-containing protein [Synergistaceae bacterium]
MAKDTEHFKVSEFTCKCGCGHNPIDQRVIDMAETIRQALDVPVRVNSGCRCEKHNAKSGGVKGSKHVLGKAADLSCSLGAVKMFETVKRLHAEGKLPELDYCIRYKTFIHIDCGGKRKSLWEIRT